jgi:hypothetical protein
MSCDCWPKSAAKSALPVQDQSLVERLTEVVTALGPSCRSVQHDVVKYHFLIAYLA